MQDGAEAMNCLKRLPVKDNEWPCCHGSSPPRKEREGKEKEKPWSRDCPAVGGNPDGCRGKAGHSNEYPLISLDCYVLYIRQTLKKNGTYTLCLINSRKVNRLHVGSIPTVPTKNHFSWKRRGSCSGLQTGLKVNLSDVARNPTL